MPENQPLSVPFLPPELWLIILVISVRPRVGSDVLDIDWSFDSIFKIRLTHVCRAWRTLCLASPSFWSSIDLSESNRQITDIFLDRAKAASLDIALTYGVDQESLLDTCDRVKSLHLRIPNRWELESARRPRVPVDLAKHVNLKHFSVVGADRRDNFLSFQGKNWPPPRPLEFHSLAFSLPDLRTALEPVFATLTQFELHRCKYKDWNVKDFASLLRSLAPTLISLYLDLTTPFAAKLGMQLSDGALINEPLFAEPLSFPVLNTLSFTSVSTETITNFLASITAMATLEIKHVKSPYTALFLPRTPSRNLAVFSQVRYLEIACDQPRCCWSLRGYRSERAAESKDEHIVAIPFVRGLDTGRIIGRLETISKLFDQIDDILFRDIGDREFLFLLLAQPSSNSRDCMLFPRLKRLRIRTESNISWSTDVVVSIVLYCRARAECGARLHDVVLHCTLDFLACGSISLDDMLRDHVGRLTLTGEAM